MFTNNHWAYAACDSVVVVVEVRTHQVIVLILQRRGVDGHFSGEFLEVQRQFFRPQNGDVWLRRRTHGVQGVQEAEAVFGDQSTAIYAHTTDRFGCPDWVTREQFIILWGTQEANHTQFHDQVVNHFLSVLLGDFTCFQVTFDVRVQEGGYTTEGHCCTVLRLNCGQVAEVGPLDSFLSVSCRTRDIAAIFSSHLFDLTQRTVLFSDLFTQTDSRFQVYAVFQIGLQGNELRVFVFHQKVDTVQRNATVVTDDTATAVGIWQTSQNTGFTAVQNVFGVNIEYTLVVGFTVFGEDFFQHWVQLAVVRFAGTFNHFDTTERDNRTFQWCFSLQTNDFLKGFVDVTSIVRSDGGSNGGVKINWRVSAVFQFYAFHYAVPQLGGRFSCASQEGFVTFIRGIVFLNEVTYVYFILPVTFCKTFPGCG
ncbi:hypothetical protein QTN38_006170 [Enterobacter cloacae subsp. cloacae]|uniref:hypothetical protein n=1 Tax=Enterobacter cloacae TaxID=550 RepID=UPI00272E72A6|nr:hypothetical protein [Enterobacter cloacae]WLD33270.1 hypothetical protein QTN38_006170 [Enterobacter cloacae subsp. cloacae]